MYYKTSLVTAPTEEPITLDELKTHLRIDTNAENTYLTSLIKGVRETIELKCGLALITQTWKLFFDNFKNYNENWWDGIKELPVGYFSQKIIEIPKAPLQSVTHIKIYDNSNIATTFSTDNYTVFTYAGVSPSNGRIMLKDGATWPYVERTVDGVEIEFVAGYGSAGDVPQMIKQYVLEEAAYRFEHQGDCDPATLNSPITRNALGLIKKTFL